MPIREQKNGSAESLIEFYQSFPDDPVWKRKCSTLIKIVKMIDTLFKESVIWALTSHERLVLIKEDNWNSPWYIILNCLGENDMYIEYLLPESYAPWKRAYVTGEARTMEGLKKKLLIAMKECGGLEENQELEKLYQEEMKNTRQESWKNFPIDKIESIKADMVFTEEQFLRMKQGVIPQQMEDKWFIYFEDGIMHFHRSWTGFEIFRASIKKQENQYVVNEFFVERNTEKYKSLGMEQDKEMFQQLIKLFFIEKKE